MTFSPAVRISLGLVSLTISLLLFGKLIGFAPDRTAAVVESRKNLSEILAVQFSAAAERGDIILMKQTMDSLVERNNDIISVAMWKTGGALLAESGNHLANWQPATGDESTPTHIQVPIFQGDKRWATVEISFTPLWSNNIASGFKHSYLSLIVFVGFAGFTGYFLLMKRTLRELDPSAVVPTRVRAAFDILKEGVLILDEKELIVLGNAAFAEIVGKSTEELLGYRGSELGWKGCKSSKEQEKLPWLQVLETGKSVMGTRLTMKRSKKDHISFIVNAVPVLDGKERCRGVLVTFDNVTEIENKNFELSQVVNKLQLTTDEVQTKNLELEFLANHDALTSLLNRRSLYRRFNEVFFTAQKNETELSCIMCDIDHFKLVNDTYGHATGDRVIKMVAALLKKQFRENDLIGRYGGEEFCVILPKITLSSARGIADRVRQAIEDDTSSGVQVTMSFGVSSLKFNAHEPEEIINQADKALYVAKKSGRNRVVCWGDENQDDISTESSAGDEENLADEINPKEEFTQERKLQDDSDTETPELSYQKEVERLSLRLSEVEELAEKRALQLQHYTVYDRLTGLPTRILFYDRVSQALARAQRYESIVAVLLLSIDVVHRVRETMGFETGDMLFKEISKRLTNNLRAIDSISKFSDSSMAHSVSRLGQVEFGILLTDVEDVNVITWIVTRIFTSFEKAFVIDVHEIYASANIGISIFPHDGQTPEELEKKAAAAKNHVAKKQGVNQYCYFSKNINALSTKHLKTESQLHKAIDNNEFILHYQPKINAVTGALLGVEALIRWNNPETGLIPPLEFIPIAEYSGLIDIIGEWVLQEACGQVRTWLDMGLKECSVAVNFSNRQFRQENLVVRIKEILHENNLDPHYLMIEVTESVMMENLNNSIKILNQLRDMGVEIALDDFGTGYSSLGYLKKFPVTHVKIDKFFIADININKRDAALVKSIIRMAHALDLQVTAEGVENQAQVEQLLNYHCDEMQGYLFSKPVSADKATKLLKKRITYKLGSSSVPETA